MYTAAVQPLWNCCRKFSEIHATRWLLWHSDFTYINFGRGSAPDPAGGAYDAPPDHLVGWEKDTPPHCPSTRRLRGWLSLAL